jgi:hypothetical protein
MDFVEWLLTKQVKKDTPVGDLARDVRGDRCLPVTDGTPAAVLHHIIAQHHACQEARDALTRAARLWRGACRRAEAAMSATPSATEERAPMEKGPGGGERGERTN